MYSWIRLPAWRIQCTLCVPYACTVLYVLYHSQPSTIIQFFFLLYHGFWASWYHLFRVNEVFAQDCQFGFGRLSDCIQTIHDLGPIHTGMSFGFYSLIYCRVWDDGNQGWTELYKVACQTYWDFPMHRLDTHAYIWHTAWTVDSRPYTAQSILDSKPRYCMWYSAVKAKICLYELLMHRSILIMTKHILGVGVLRGLAIRQKHYVTSNKI